MKRFQITEWYRHFIEEHVREGALCIDATAGNGWDTVLLCGLVGETGRVLAFDIQKEALDATRSRLAESGFSDRAGLYLESHTHMADYASPGTVDCIVFNFGYLPGGSHAFRTMPETSTAAVEQGLALLKEGGLMCLCIYSGGDTGFEERDALLSLLKGLDPRRYLVILSSYYNRPNHPPIPALIYRLVL